MRTISINNQEITISELLNMIQSKLELVADNHPSQYITIAVCEETEDEYLEELIKIRASNHSAKRANNDYPTLSFVTDTCDQGYSGMGYNEYVVESIEDMHTNETNMSGWLTIEEVLEDFINDVKFS